MFHQSGGCCDGSSPMCYPDGEFLVGDRDILLAVLESAYVGDGVPVWISGPQFEAWKHTQLVIDVVPGRGGGFSVEAPEGMRFLSRGRAFSNDREPVAERAGSRDRCRLRAGSTTTDDGQRTSSREAIDACPIPGPTT